MSVLVPAKFPSLSAVFMAAAASVLLLFVARILFLLMRLWSCPMVRPESQDKEIPLRSLAFFANPWGRSLQWNILPVSLPFTLTLSEKPSSEVGNGVGVGLAHKRGQMLPVVNWRPRIGPQFQPPPPALYENPVPLSMAKMIMSRHVRILFVSSTLQALTCPLTDVPQTKSEPLTAILDRLLFPTDVTTTDTFPPIPFNSIAPLANPLPPKAILHKQCDALFNLFYAYACTRSRLRLSGICACYNHTIFWTMPRVLHELE
ncbi:hypothetical protein V8E55_002885 [Tylopilus felleus]